VCVLDNFKELLNDVVLCIGYNLEVCHSHRPVACHLIFRPVCGGKIKRKEKEKSKKERKAHTHNHHR